MIYAIQCGDKGPVKFGIAENPQERLGALQIGSPYQLTLVGCQSTEDDAKAEEAIHRQLQRDWMRGEWFKPTKQVMAAAYGIAAGLLSQWLDGDGMDLGYAKAIAVLTKYHAPKLKEFDLVRHFAKRHAGRTEEVRYG